MTMEPVTLYGMEVSGNTGRARSYLIKAGIPFRERAPNSAHYMTTVVPLAGGVRTMPTLEFPDGSVIRDGAAIIDHFEGETGYTFSPTGPKQRFVSRLFDVIGAEGMMRPGMHYRWSFPDENLAFMDYHTIKVIPDGFDVPEMTRNAHRRMQNATGMFGVNPQTFDLVEQLYAEQLAALDRHFDVYPYLLGGRPSIGDFGMMIMLYAHLGRDPKPLSLMYAHGLNVYRWVERMNRHGSDLVEFGDLAETYLDHDEIPETVIDLLAVMAQDFVPETLAAAETINTWITAQEDLAPGTPCARGLGYAEFELRGTPISALAAPYRFYLLKRAQDEYAALGEDDRQALNVILDRCNMTPVLGATLLRDIGRKDNLEVWL